MTLRSLSFAALLLVPFVSGCATTGGDGSPQAIASVESTSWEGTDSDGDHYIYRFLPGGRLSFTSPTGTYNDSDTWKQDGNKIYFETNNKYSEYEGVIEGNTMHGKAWNVNNHTWTWTATRQ